MKRRKFLQALGAASAAAPVAATAVPKLPEEEAVGQTPADLANPEDLPYVTFGGFDDYTMFLNEWYDYGVGGFRKEAPRLALVTDEFLTEFSAPWGWTHLRRNPGMDGAFYRRPEGPIPRGTML